MGKANEILSGKQFYGTPESAIQWGGYKFNSGYKFSPHIHKIRKREFLTKTPEFFYVISGAIKFDFYDNLKNKIFCKIINPEEFVCCYDGGHSLSVLKDCTKFLEIKLGPFTSAKEDKETFDDQNI
jgi:hypothetical protein